MKQKETEQTKSHAELVADQVRALKPDKDYVYDPNVPIPLGRSVLVKKINQTNLTVTDAGVMLLEGMSEKSHPPHLGIIQAVGPQCSEFIKIGMRIYYNFFVDSSFRVGGIEYAKMHEDDVFYVIPSQNTVVLDGVKSDKQVGREKRIERQKTFIPIEHRLYENEKDMRKDKTKGKIRPVGK